MEAIGLSAKMDWFRSVLIGFSFDHVVFLMLTLPQVNLHPQFTTGAQVYPTGELAWHLEIPAGPAGRYRLAQLDDYQRLPRHSFSWRPPLRLSMRARASATSLPGTWGFGLWNDPFGIGMIKGAGFRLPVLPNTAWFFFASTANYLSLRNDLPAQGLLAATFRSPLFSSARLLLASPLLAMLIIPAAARRLRHAAQRFIRQDAVDLTIDPTEWHLYEVEWYEKKVLFMVDMKSVLETSIVPIGPLGLVIWIDNQYAALPPTGRLTYGTLENPEPAWIGLEGLTVSPILV